MKKLITHLMAASMLVNAQAVTMAHAFPSSSAPAVERAAAPTYTMGGWSTTAGKPIYFNISRQAGAPPATIEFITHDGTAVAGQDYVSTTVTINADSTFTTQRVTVPTIVDANKQGQTLHFSASLKVNGVVVSTAGAAVTQPVGPVLPEFGGAPSIASDFDPVLGMSTTTFNTLDNGVDPVGAFRFICGGGGVNYDDPIVFPGQPGKSHLHQYYGVTANAFTTYQSLRNAKDSDIRSTCSGDNVHAAGAHVLNRSAYWMPAVLVGNKWVLQPNDVSVYYKRLPLSNKGCAPYALGTGGTELQNLQAAQTNGGKGTCVPIPNGIKFIFGYDMVTNTPPTGHSYIGCITTGGHPVIDGHTFVDVATCPVGDELDVRLSAPDCWDGKDLDSANHRDHVSYMVADKWTAFPHCDAAHPYQMPTFTIAVIYPVTPEVSAALTELKAEATAGTPWDYTKVLHFSSDEMRSNLIPGQTEHADFLEAHDPFEKKMWDVDADGCINGHKNCSGGDMGNGHRIDGATIPYYNGIPRWSNPVPLIPIPPKPSATGTTPSSM